MFSETVMLSTSAPPANSPQVDFNWSNIDAEHPERLIAVASAMPVARSFFKLFLSIVFCNFSRESVLSRAGQAVIRLRRWLNERFYEVSSR